MWTCGLHFNKRDDMVINKSSQSTIVFTDNSDQVKGSGIVYVGFDRATAIVSLVETYAHSNYWY